jgi:galactokinase
VSAAAEIFVPGRLCLFGEHSDWAALYRASDPSIERGYCLVAGTDQGLYARAEAASDTFEIVSDLPDGSRAGPLCLPAQSPVLDAAAREGSLFSYAAGVAAEVGVRHPVRGLRMFVRGDLPMGRGLASSAALCVLVARSFNRIYQLGLGSFDEMELAYAGERRVGSECGRMDQICAFGQGPMFVRFDGPSFEVERLEPGGTLFLLVVDLCQSKDTRRILKDLNACFPRTQGPVAAGVREALGPRNVELLGRAREIVRAGDARALGALMVEAQALFDSCVAPACPELRAPRLHAILTHPALREFAFGGKGVGSQGDGCAQLVARGPEERRALSARLESELRVRCFPVTLRPGPKD